MAQSTFNGETTVFDDLLAELSRYETGMANATLKSKVAIANQLMKIATKAVIILNEGSMPPGTKSVVLRIERWTRETAAGVSGGSFRNLTEIRVVSKEQLGLMHSGLRQAINGGLSAANKEVLRTHFDADEDKTTEVNRLLEAFDPGATKIGGVAFDEKTIKEAAYTFLAQNFTLSQLRSIQPYLPLEEGQTKPKRDPDCKWNHATYLDIREALVADAKGRAKMSAFKRELVAKHDNAHKELSESYKNLQRRLPRNIQHAYSAFYFPVVPSFKDINAYKSNRLESAGFKVTWVGDHFPVLENQLILCIDLKKVGVSESLSPTKDGERLKTVKNGEEIRKKISEIIAEINVTAARTGVKLVPASDTVVRNPVNAHMTLVWLIPEHSRRLLAEMLNNTQVSWDIPRHELTKERD